MNHLPQPGSGRWLPAALIAVTALATALPAQESLATHFHDCKAWRGTLVASATVDPAAWAQLQATMGAGKVQLGIDYTIYSEVEFELTDLTTEPWVWTGKVTRSRYESGYRSTAKHDGGDQESAFEANGALAFDADHEVRLEFHHDDTWSVNLPSGKVPTQLRERVTFREGQTFRNQQDGVCYGMGGTQHHRFPTGGAVLFASDSTKTRFRGIDGQYGMTPPVVWQYAVYLEPLAFDELRLEIDEPKGYATWLPETTPECGPGRPLAVTARLVTADGNTPKVSVTSFEWELIKTSREPGVALNWPCEANDQRCDLDLDADGGFFQREDENQRLVRAVQAGHQDTVKVVPFDWGGWTTLRVTAVTGDGRRVLGRLRGAEDSGLRIPKRAPDSKIADVFRERTGCGADALDEDARPVGDGNLGDGFANYEEYRGFVMNGGHIRTSPKQKDLFVRNRVGRRLLPGIFLFADVTGIRVRYELREGEMPTSRVMNANRSSRAPRSSDQPQHGLYLELVEGGDASVAMTQRETLVGIRPKDIDRIVINADLLAPDRAEELRSTVAHEMAHSVGVPHHGEGDDYVVWLRKQRIVDGKPEQWFEERPARSHGGQFEFPSTPGPHIRIFAADGREVLPANAEFLTQPRVLFLGHQGGQHSGDVGCFMRYVAAEAFVVAGQPDCRQVSPGEPSGLGICDAATGTEFNAPTLPKPRYGDATCGRCRQQLCVRDDAPVRER